MSMNLRYGDLVVLYNSDLYNLVKKAGNPNYNIGVKPDSMGYLGTTGFIEKNIYVQVIQPHPDKQKIESIDTDTESKSTGHDSRYELLESPFVMNQYAASLRSANELEPPLAKLVPVHCSRMKSGPRISLPKANAAPGGRGSITYDPGLMGVSASKNSTNPKRGSGMSKGTTAMNHRQSMDNTALNLKDMQSGRLDM